MSAALRKSILPVVAVMAVTTGCSSGGDNGTAEADRGKSAREVCGAFAKDAPSSAALKAITGDERFRSDLSEPEKALETLRDTARFGLGENARIQGIPYCRLLPVKNADSAVRIDLRPVLAALERDPRLEGTVTYFTSGELASSSEALASVFFTCRMKVPAHEIVIQAQLEGPDLNKAPQKDIRAHQVTLANAVARKVAVELGCRNDTKLVSGVPAPAPAR
ncbi:hypothetical protein ACFU5O_04645 [Streptomyces sp. NPDC057445]|uniref:hypothetical protein n=1 Tax=Streptomyces sp. NPDC057445 TaxID=3346136 RepID=UPI003688B47D